MTPYYDKDGIILYCSECSKVMADVLPDDSVDLTVTSPPYDNLREYDGYEFNFEAIAQQLWRVTKPGGVVVWVVGDMSSEFSESLTSFKQALFFAECGFNLLDTMIYLKNGGNNVGIHNWRNYPQEFEYMFVFSSGKPNTFNPIRDKINRKFGNKIRGTQRKPNGQLETVHGVGKIYRKYGYRTNVWTYSAGYMLSSKDKISFNHPATFPEALARDHIISWSNPGDIVLDPMCGSGTVPKMCVETGRQCIGIDISEKYCKLSRQRIAGGNPPLPGLEIGNKPEPEQLSLNE